MRVRLEAYILIERVRLEAYIIYEGPFRSVHYISFCTERVRRRAVADSGRVRLEAEAWRRATCSRGLILRVMCTTFLHSTCELFAMLVACMLATFRIMLTIMSQIRSAVWVAPNSIEARVLSRYG